MEKFFFRLFHVCKKQKMALMQILFTLFFKMHFFEKAFFEEIIDPVFSHALFLSLFVVLTENLLCIVADTCINFQDMVPNEPDQVGKVRDGGFVDNEPQHGLIFHFVNIETQGPHRNSHHRFTVVKELDGFRIQREIVGVLQ